jgi:hypothetical protein
MFVFVFLQTFRGFFLAFCEKNIRWFTKIKEVFRTNENCWEYENFRVKKFKENLHIFAYLSLFAKNENFTFRFNPKPDQWHQSQRTKRTAAYSHNQTLTQSLLRSYNFYISDVQIASTCSLPDSVSQCIGSAVSTSTASLSARCKLPTPSAIIRPAHIQI